jgi:hypothetical protein
VRTNKNCKILRKECVLNCPCPLTRKRERVGKKPAERNDNVTLMACGRAGGREEVSERLRERIMEVRVRVAS